MSTTSPPSGPLSDEDLNILKGWIVQSGVGFALYGVEASFALIALYFILYMSPIALPDLNY